MSNFMTGLGLIFMVLAVCMWFIGWYDHRTGSVTRWLEESTSYSSSPVRMGEKWYDMLGRYAFPSPPESENFHRPY
jgi:hypothetical protein